MPWGMQRAARLAVARSTKTALQLPPTMCTGGKWACGAHIEVAFLDADACLVDRLEDPADVVAEDAAAKHREVHNVRLAGIAVLLRLLERRQQRRLVARLQHQLREGLPQAGALAAATLDHQK